MEDKMFLDTQSFWYRFFSAAFLGVVFSFCFLFNPYLSHQALAGGMPVYDALVYEELVMFHYENVAAIEQAGGEIVAAQEAAAEAEITNDQTITNEIEPEQRFLRDILVKRIVDEMTNEVVQWAQSGFEGSPMFIQDWRQFADQAVDIAFSSVLEDLGSKWGVNLCGPFLPQLQVHLALLAEGANSRYSYTPRCTVENFTQNIQNMATMFESGGWVSFDNMISPDGNNPVWLSMRLSDEFYRTTQNQSEANKNEAEAGGGFLSQKKCIDPEGGDSTNCKRWQAQTPGDLVADEVAQSFGADFQYSDNIQSMVAAVVNGLITILMNELQKGLSDVSMSTVDYDQMVNNYQASSTPGAPQSLTAIPGNGQVSLSWNEPNNNGGDPIKDYTVKYRPILESSWSVFDDGISVGTTATVTGLANGSKYNFKVTAVNSIGSGSSASVSATPTGSTPQ